MNFLKQNENNQSFDSQFANENYTFISTGSIKSNNTLNRFLASKQDETTHRLATHHARSSFSSHAQPFNELSTNTFASNLQKSIATTDIPNSTLFVGNLHPSINEHDLSELFKVFGTHQAPKCSKQWIHFGFVKYSTEKEAVQAYRALNGVKIKGRAMRLEFQNRTKKYLLEKADAEAKQLALRSLVSQQMVRENSQSKLNLLLKPTTTTQQQHQALESNYFFDIEQFLDTELDLNENSSVHSSKCTTRDNKKLSTLGGNQMKTRESSNYSLFSSSLDYDFLSAAFGNSSGNTSTTTNDSLTSTSDN